MPSRRVLLSLALALSLCVCTSWADDGPLTPTELVSELTAISQMLKTAQTQYLQVSTELAQLQSQEMPALTLRLTDLTRSFDAYRRGVSREINRLRAGNYLAIGAAIVAGILAIVGWVT